MQWMCIQTESLKKKLKYNTKEKKHECKRAGLKVKLYRFIVLVKLNFSTHYFSFLLYIIFYFNFIILFAITVVFLIYILSLLKEFIFEINY